MFRYPQRRGEDSSTNPNVPRGSRSRRRSGPWASVITSGRRCSAGGSVAEEIVWAKFYEAEGAGGSLIETPAPRLSTS